MHPRELLQARFQQVIGDPVRTDSILLGDHIQHGLYIRGMRAVRGQSKIFLQRLSRLGRGLHLALCGYRQIGKEI